MDELPSQTVPKPTKGDALVTVATFQTVFDASVAKGALEAEGMEAFVPSEGLGSFSRVPPRELWAELKVRAKDRDRAVKVLRQAGHQ